MRNALLVIILLCEAPIASVAQPPPPLDFSDKLRFHAEGAFGPQALGISGLKAGFLQLVDSPTEWGQGTSGYGRRVASSVGSSGIRAVFALGLDSTLHQDPRYFRTGGSGVWRRVGHALRGTILTHTDRGGETLSTWRLGSVYGAAFLSNQWYPDRLNTVRWGFADGTVQLGFDLASNVAIEFWPDIRKKISRRRP